MAEGQAMQMDAFGGNGMLSAPITQARTANGITEEMHSPLASEQPSASDHGAGNVQKIRDILFGTQMREYDTRFFKLEENLARELADIREAGRKRAETTEAYLNQEIESLRTRLKSEREERAESARQIARDLSVLGHELLKKLTALDEQLVQTERQLRLEMREASKNLSENASRVHEEAVALIDRRFQELRKGKIDRTALASMLTEVALRLNNESQTAAASA